VDNDPLDMLVLVEFPVLVGSFVAGRALATQWFVMTLIGVWGVFIHQSYFGNHMDHHKLPNSSYAPIFPWLDLLLGTTSFPYSLPAKLSICTLLAQVLALLGMPLVTALVPSVVLPLSAAIAANFLFTMGILQSSRGDTCKIK
jgi:hypothetical protein